MARPVRTLPFASVSGGGPKFSPTNEQWKQIERAYGHALTDNVRQAIVAATINFLLWEPFEREAKPISRARERVVTVQKAAKSLHDALVLYEELVTAPATTATVYAHQLIKRHFAGEEFWSAKFRSRNGGELARLKRVLAPLPSACASALAELDDPNLPGYCEGACWRGWVRDLTRIAKQHKLPIPVRTDTDKKWRPSPFVALLYELQQHVPVAARRHMHSKAALAKAIQRARRGRGGNATISPDLGNLSDESLYRYATR